MDDRDGQGTGRCGAAHGNERRNTKKHLQKKPRRLQFFGIKTTVLKLEDLKCQKRQEDFSDTYEGTSNNRHMKGHTTVDR